MKTQQQRMMYNIIKYTWLGLLFPLFATAQEDNAFAGKNAVFVYNVYEPASPQFPDVQGNTGFTLQRREKAVGSPWTSIKQFHSPQNAAELQVNYLQAKNIFPDNQSPFDAGTIWDKWQKFKSFDSLAYQVGNPVAQMAFGIVLMDSSVTANKTYQYRILKNKQAVPVPSEVSNLVEYPAKISMRKPKFYKRTTERDVILLEWSADAFTAATGFNVYRAAGAEKQFTPIKPGTFSMNRNDTLVYSMQDNSIVYGQVYRYYITPVNQFGGGGNVISDTVTATCVKAEQLQSPQYISTRPDEKEKAIVISYTLPNPALIGSVHIMRSTDFDNGFNEIAVTAPHDTVFVDHRIVAGKKYYYYLLMTDKLGRNGARSIRTFGLYQTPGNTTPAQYVNAAPVDRGIRITWRNPPDTSVISGYYVCRSEGRSGKFQRITILLPRADSLNSYTDTSRLLKTNTLYAYSIVSENLSNKVSQNSVIAYATPGKLSQAVALMTPRNVKTIPENNSVRLLWMDMRLVNSNVVYYNIYRKSNVDTNFKPIALKYPAGYTSFKDSLTTPGMRYTYVIETADRAGNVSAQATGDAVWIKTEQFVAPSISIFAAKNGAVIAWEPVSDGRIKNYIIYRYPRGEQPVKIGTAPAAGGKFEDSGVAAGKTWYYYIEPDTENTSFLPVASNKVYLAR